MVDIASLPLPSFSPEELYCLLSSQVSSYHKHYRMGENTSVPLETAQELLQSIQYTLQFASLRGSIQDALTQGQATLWNLLEESRRLHRLVLATGSGDSQWWWEAMESLGSYLARYDVLHFAHRIPEDLFYPIALPVPKQLQGISWALFYLRCLWQENQILLSFPEDALEELYLRLPPGYFDGPEMRCQQPLWNALGRTLLSLPLNSLLLSPAQRDAIVPQISHASLEWAAGEVCRTLALPEDASSCARAVIKEAFPRILAALPSGDLSCIFR